MKKILCLLAFTTLILSSFAQTKVGYQDVVTIETGDFTYKTAQCLLWLPTDYATSKTTYPLIVALPGNGEAGTDIKKLLSSDNGQIQQRIANGLVPKGSDGTQFIVLTPQCPVQWGWSTQIPTMIGDLIKKGYRVDENRVYITGLSGGGWGVTQSYLNDATVNKVAAAVIISPGNYSDGAVTIGKSKTPTWIVCRTGEAYYNAAQNIYNTIKSNKGNAVTSYRSGNSHDIWSLVYDPAQHWPEIDNLNFYDWLLTNTKGKTSAPVSHVIKVPAGATHYAANPGDTLEFSGKYTYFYNDGSNGTAEKPIVYHFKNATFANGIDFKGAKHFVLYGDGVSNSNYKDPSKYTWIIRGNGKGTGLSFGQDCDSIEVRGVKVTNVAYFIGWKEEISCDTVSRPVMDGITLKNFYFDTAYQDGGYFGSTNEQLNRSISCNGKIITPKYVTQIRNLKVSNGIVKNTQRNGFNVSNTNGGSNIFNTIYFENCGMGAIRGDADSSSQGAGIVTGGKVNNITLKNITTFKTWLPGVKVSAGGKVVLDNIKIDSADYVTWGGKKRINSQKNAAMQLVASNSYNTTWTVSNLDIGYSNNKVALVLYDSKSRPASESSCIDAPKNTDNHTGRTFKSCTVAPPEEKPPVTQPTDPKDPVYTLTSTTHDTLISIIIPQRIISRQEDVLTGFTPVSTVYKDGELTAKYKAVFRKKTVYDTIPAYTYNTVIRVTHDTLLAGPLAQFFNIEKFIVQDSIAFDPAVAKLQSFEEYSKQPVKTPARTIELHGPIVPLISRRTWSIKSK